MKTSPRSLLGLTLIELLIAVAITAVLLALLFPSYQRARQMGNIARGSSNLKTISTALFAYANENNGRLVQAAISPGFRGTTVGYWFNVLDYYCGGDDWTAEGQRRGDRPGWQNDPLKVYPQPIYDGSKRAVNVGYGWNFQHFGYSPTSSSFSDGIATRLLSIEQPARTIVVGTNKDDPLLQSTSHALLYANKAGVSTRYNGRGIYLFADGHLEILAPDEVCADDFFLFKRVKPNP